MTLEGRMIATGGRATGFDYLRIILAISVVIWHSFTTSYGNEFAHRVLTSPFRPLIAVIVPMFFALSGFLVAGSLFRNSVFSFFGLRAIRIVPALAVETLLSAIILGPILTTIPIRDYFKDPLFFKYICNIIGWIHYRLPGLFLNNPVADRVNGQLWTVPWELWCYLILIFGGLTRIIRMRAIFGGLTVTGTIALFAFEFLSRHGHMDPENGVAPPALLMAFLSAVSIYLYRDKLPWSGWACITSTIFMITLFLIPGGDYLLGFPAAYTTIYLGLMNPRKAGVLKGTDYSYGIYIYHYVIQQAFVFLFPTMIEWFIVFPVSFVISSIFAAISWHMVEKPAIRLRKYLPKIETAIGSVIPRNRRFIN